MRLIDADALIEKWYEINDIGPEDRGARFVGYTEIPRFINNAPTIETTGYYISRADAIKAVEQEYRVDRGYMVDDYTYGFNQAIQYVSDIILQDLPSAEAEWIPVKTRPRMSKKNCPICDYPYDMCQCRFGGNAHPDRSKRARVVADHIYLLSDGQIEHLKQVQKWWNIVYADEEMNQILAELGSEVEE